MPSKNWLLVNSIRWDFYSCFQLYARWKENIQEEKKMFNIQKLLILWSIHSYNKAELIFEVETKSWEFDNFYLIVFKQLRPLLLICWSDKVAFHIKWNWVKMDSFYELKSFQLSKTYPSSYKISGDVLMHVNTCTCTIESIGANIRTYTPLKKSSEQNYFGPSSQWILVNYAIISC